eukprot:3472362-Rhodomonas_salina.1
MRRDVESEWWPGGREGRKEREEERETSFACGGRGSTIKEEEGTKGHKWSREGGKRVGCNGERMDTSMRVAREGGGGFRRCECDTRKGRKP